MSLFTKSLTYALSLGLVLSPTAFGATSKMQIEAAEILRASGGGAEVRTKINQGLTRPEVLRELEKLGIEKSEVEYRLAGMTDSELAQVQQGVHRQAGGDVIVISGAAIIIIVLLILLIMK